MNNHSLSPLGSLLLPVGLASRNLQADTFTFYDAGAVNTSTRLYRVVAP